MANSVSKGALKAKMHAYLREVEKTKIELIVTDNKVPVLKIIPFSDNKKSVDDVFSNFRGKVTYFEDINTPTSDEWEEI